PPPRRSEVGPQYRSTDDGRRDDDTTAKEYSPPLPIVPGACRGSKSGAREITVTPMADTQLPGVFGDVQPLLEHYGYLGVGGMLFLEDFGVPVPGEIMLIAAAAFAGAGQMNIAVVFLVAVLAAVIGDNIGFVVGHFGGRPLAERFGRYIFLTPQRLDRGETFFKRHRRKVVAAHRFIDRVTQI